MKSVQKPLRNRMFGNAWEITFLKNKHHLIRHVPQSGVLSFTAVNQMKSAIRDVVLATLGTSS